MEQRRQIKISIEINKKTVKNGAKMGVPISTIIETGKPHAIKIGKERRNKKSCKEKRFESFSMNFIKISLRYFIDFVEQKIVFRNVFLLD